MNKLLVKCALLLNKLISPLGAILVAYPTGPEKRRKLLMGRRQISLVIDIGANTGQYSSSLRAHGYEGEIWSFEPLPTAYAKLKKKAANDALWSVSNCAISDKEGWISFYVAENSESSSVQKMLPRHVAAAANSKTIDTISVASTSIGNVLDRASTQNIMLKLDTQGHEAQILTDAKIRLGRVALIELEMSLVPLYEGQQLFRELDTLLVDSGFKLSSISEGFFDSASGELLQFDAIYENTLLR